MEIALNFILNYPIDIPKDGGAPLPDIFEGLGSRIEKAEAGRKVRDDLRAINNMPQLNEQQEKYKKQILSKYLANIITKAEIQNNQEVPEDFVDRTITFLLNPVRGRLLQSNLLAFVQRNSISNAAFLNQLLIRIRKYLRGLSKNLEKITGKTQQFGEGQLEQVADLEEMTADERIELKEEQLMFRIKMTRLTLDDKYFLEIFLNRKLPKMKKYNLLNISGNRQALIILNKIKKKLEKPLSPKEEEVFNLYRLRYELELD